MPRRACRPSATTTFSPGSDSRWKRVIPCRNFGIHQVKDKYYVAALALSAGIDRWSLTSLQQRLLKTGGRLIKHARYYSLLLAESHLTRWLFGNTLRRIAMLPAPAG